MNKEELLEYIDNNSTAVANFKDKVRTDQQVRNKKRQPAKRWNDARIERQVDKFTDEFNEENELLDDLEGSVSMIDFEEE